MRMLRAAMLAVVDRFRSPAELRNDLLDANGAPKRWLVERCRGKHDASDAYATTKAAQLVALLLPERPDAGLLNAEGGDGTYFWSLDPYGRELAAPRTLDEYQADITEAEALVRADEEMKAGGLSLQVLQDECAFFTSATKWPGFEHSLGKLKDAVESASRYPAMAEDRAAIAGYVYAVEASLPAIDRAVSLASALRGDLHLRVGLAATAMVMNLSIRTAARRLEIIEACWAEFRKSRGITETSLPPVALKTIDQLGPRFLVGEPAARLAPQEIDDAFWARWKERLRDQTAGRTAENPPSWAEVAWAIAHQATPLLRRAFETDNASAWTEVALSALSGVAASDGLAYPAWCGVAAFLAMRADGLARLVAMRAALADWEQLSRGRRAVSRRFVLVVVPRGSKAASWTVSSERAAVVVYDHQLEALSKALARLASEDRDAVASALSSPALLVQPSGDVARTIVDDPIHQVPVLAEAPWGSVWEGALRGWLVEQDVKPEASLLRAAANVPRIVAASQLDETLDALMQRPSSGRNDGAAGRKP